MFLYFIPRTGNPFATPPELRYIGDRGDNLTTRETLGGPEGAGPGWVCAMRPDRPDRVELQPSKQRWTRLHVPNAPADAPPIFVGRWLDDTLQPGRLQRAAMQPGHPVALADGTQWTAAIARGFDAANAATYTPLPRALSYDAATGKWMPGPVAREYTRFLELALSYVEAADAAALSGADTFPFPDVDELAVGALTVNYRIGPAELSLFDGVYDVATRDALVLAALDMPTLRPWIESKKKELAGGGSATNELPPQSEPAPLSCRKA